MLDISTGRTFRQSSSLTPQGIPFVLSKIEVVRRLRESEARSINSLAWEVKITPPGPKSKILWQERGSSTVSISASDIEWLERAYTFQDRNEVLRFLYAYPFLTPLLSAAYYEILRYFPSSQITLKVYHDREDELGEDQVVVTIHTALLTDDAINRLRNLDESWWLDAMEDADGKMIIDLEFQ